MDLEEYGRIARAEDAHWWYRSVRLVLATAAEAHLQHKTGRFLDAGCGPGGNSKWVPSEFDVYGVDISSEAVAYATEKRPELRVVQASVTELPFDANSFDGLQSITVVCHAAVASVESALSEYRRVLRAEGLLLLVEPAFEVLRRSHDRVVSAERRFRLPSLCKQVEACGFEVKGATYFFATLALPALLLALQDRLTGKRARKSDLERSGAADALFRRAASAELRLAEPALTRGGRSPIPFGTSCVIVATKR